MAKKPKTPVKDDSAVSQYMGETSETGVDSKSNKKKKSSKRG